MNSTRRLLWCVVAFLAVQWCHTADAAPPPTSVATNIMPGCEVTSTRSYKSYITPGWNGRTPDWVVVASDSQYPRSRNPNGSETDQNPSNAVTALTAVLTDIGRFRESVGWFNTRYTPVIINGDLTDFGHGWQRQTMQTLFQKLAGHDGSHGPLFFPGLGNHDYSNNVNDCANNGCARDSVCDVLQWIQEIGPRNWDYHYAKPGHRGSYGYSVDIQALTIIELHDSPMYNVHFESGGFPINDKVKFEVTSSLRWLEGALRDARSRNHIIFLNMHRRNVWPAGDRARFRQLIESYGVTAVFAGHVHGELGLAQHDEHFGSVPVFQSGALFARSYLIVNLDHAWRKVRVYAVDPGKGYEQKRFVAEIPLVNGTQLPTPNFSDAAMVLYEGSNATQDFQCEVPLSGYPRFNMGSTYGCPNDEAKSLRILKAKKGTRIELFGNWDQKPDQGFAVIEVKEDITTPIMVGSFERKWEESNWKIQRYGEGTLDGKISSVAVSNGIDFSRGTITLFEGNGGTEKALCTKSLNQNAAFDMGGSSGCANDEARSALIRNARRGTEVCLYGNWGQQTNQGYSCIVALKDFTENLVWTFNTDDWHEPDGSYMAYNRNGNIDGKISSMRIRK